MAHDKITILIANKYFLMNYAIHCILQKIKGFDVHGVTEDSLLSEIKRLRPDILVVEIEVIKTNSYRLLMEIKRKYPALKILVLIDVDDEERLLKVMEFRLEGYLLKNASREELIQAAQSIHRGEKYYSKGIHNFVIEHLIDLNNPSAKKQSHVSLSMREREILQLFVEGMNNCQVADTLCISEHTVLTHRRNIMRKLQVKNSAQLIIKALQTGIITVKD